MMTMKKKKRELDVGFLIIMYVMSAIVITPLLMVYEHFTLGILYSTPMILYLLWLGYDSLFPEVD